MRRFAPFLIPLLLTGCAAVTMETAGEDVIARAVEPSLRAAAANAEANNDWKGAAQHWGTLHQRHPEDTAISLSLARSWRYGGQPQQAADLMQDTLSRTGRDVPVLIELGKDYLAAERLGLALKILEEARAKAPDIWDIHSAMGVALDSLGRYPEAQGAYERALELAPDNPVVLNNLGLSQAQSGQLSIAIDTLQRANEHPGAGPQLRQNLALLLALKGDAPAAERMAAKDLPPDMVRTNAGIYRTLAGAAR
ncbi:MAG: tetratricopeptide repeat protein [Rhodospirillaceae bacterium]|nr:tetratricopeptide repeat protein [Rhodospirillales bacterium]